MAARPTAPPSTKVAAGSPATAAGLQAGDIIVSMDGQPIDSMAVLALSLRDYDAGAMVDLAYVRDGELRHASAVLVERPSTPRRRRRLRARRIARARPRRRS